MSKRERRCVACRTESQQYDLIRIARIDGEYLIDKNFKLGGRGAYVCKKPECIALTIKKHLLNKAYKCNVGSKIYEELGEYEQSN